MEIVDTWPTEVAMQEVVSLCRRPDKVSHERICTGQQFADHMTM